MITIIAVVLAAYGALMLVLYLAQDLLVFPARREVYRTPADAGWAFEDVTVRVGSETTHGWYISVENTRGTILVSHGNAGNIADRLESVDLLRALRFDVLIYDYGGYGKSTGPVCETRCYADIRAMWRHLVETRGVPCERIALFGRSLGGAVTADLAAEERAGAVILESTFLSLRQLAQELYPIVPARWLLRPKFDTASKVGRISSPLLIAHSPDDRLVRYKHGLRLFELANEPKTFFELSGNHNEGFMEMGKAYQDGLNDFLKPLLP